MNTDREQTARYTVVIIGAGTGGIAVAASLRRANPGLEIALIEPSDSHYYQPGWTLVGGGQYNINATRRDTASLLPPSTVLINGQATSFMPENKLVGLQDGRRIAYEVLIVAAGIQLNWNAIEGLSETLGHNGVTSNYRRDLAPYTWRCVNEFKGGTAIFTQPGTPIKCAGAPQKALYLSADYFRRQGIKAELYFYSAAGAVFGVPFYAKALDEVMAAYGANTVFNRELVAVDGPNKTATFEHKVDGETQREHVRFDLLHVVPPQGAPDFIRSSTLANEAGWLEVDAATLQHVRHANIFGIGDCTSAPNSKTAAAVKAQVPVVVKNVLSHLKAAPLQARYDGYAACPLTTSAGKVLLAEFSYGGVVTPSLPLDPRQPRRLYWSLKKTWLPYFYWHLLLKGRAVPAIQKKRDFPDQLPSIEP
ncbi:NAD(P)/FAD-dependent oxidoreductase [Allopusillimonas ginsengisoli]|uniref:NAD(P)/FAD-dependent oxidoreductase n=1 Tax=Allopusillimonas ginsengisoli TaxID=453575 RepID=UPI001021C377|nr:FAD/NAD(P)-binding oxidoreductase [Allopusillimonas ginsengisoli]TEA72275.1 NAD(P)/FAD-dependent oxidoreductase [Allopusillimonas ginsengisoli]